MRELSIFIDESGDFGPFEKHSPFYVLSLVFHDQSDDIGGHLDKIHEALVVRGPHRCGRSVWSRYGPGLELIVFGPLASDRCGPRRRRVQALRRLGFRRVSNWLLSRVIH